MPKCKHLISYQNKLLFFNVPFYSLFLHIVVNNHSHILIIMNIGNKIIELRKAKNWSQSDLSKEVGVSREIIGRYERDEVSPSLDTAKKIADALDTTLDYVVGEKIASTFDKKTVKRIQEIEKLDNDIKEKIFFVIDNIIQNTKAKQAYAS